MALNKNTKRPIPFVVVSRLVRYRRALIYCQESLGKELISSLELARMTQYQADQIRKDLSYFGEFGIPGQGYSVKKLLARLNNILKLQKDRSVALVGVGNLGKALLGYPGFARQGFQIVMAFDRDPAKVGKNVGGVRIQSISQILKGVPAQKIRVGVVAVPAEYAQEIVDLLIDARVRAIINFAPVRVRVPRGVVLRNVDLTHELEVVSYYV